LEELLIYIKDYWRQELVYSWRWSHQSHRRQHTPTHKQSQGLRYVVRTKYLSLWHVWRAPWQARLWLQWCRRSFNGSASVSHAAVFV